MNSLCIGGIRKIEFFIWFYATRMKWFFWRKNFIIISLQVLFKMLYTLVLNHEKFSFFYHFLNPVLWALIFFTLLISRQNLEFYSFWFFMFFLHYTINETFNVIKIEQCDFFFSRICMVWWSDPFFWPHPFFGCVLDETDFFGFFFVSLHVDKGMWLCIVGQKIFWKTWALKG